MKQHLPYYISQNEDLKRTLLSQEGGIMKYLGEHLDADGLDATYKGYRDLCTHDFREAHKWSMSEEEIKLDALNNQHIKDELNYKATLNSELNDVPAEVAKMINDFIEKYLEYAYDENRQRTHPNGITPKDFYQEVTNQYREPLGLANECMKLLLIEHRHEDREEKRWYPPSDIATTKFFIHQYVRLLNNNDTFYRLRQGVREILSGKSDDECRQLAIDMMQGVRFFSQSLYDSSNIYIDYLDGYGTFHPDGKWLRKIIENRPSCKRNSLHFCFSVFVWRLREIGRIWAAQLLVHGIDMHELEKGTNCILFPVEGDGTRSLFPYYVDKYYSNEPPGEYCVRDREHAKELLGMIKNKDDVSESLLEAIGKGGITVNGDLVLSKQVENEIGNVEAGGIGIQNVYHHEEPEGGDDPCLPKELDTDNARKYFPKAIERQYMQVTADGKYHWTGTGDRGVNAQLAYFLGRVYNYKHTVNGNAGENFPEESLNELFGVKRLYSSLTQVYNAQKRQRWRAKIDALFVQG